MKFLSNILVKAGLVVEGTTDLQGTATAITQSSSDSSTKIATTAFVKNQGYAVGNVYTTDGSLSGNRAVSLNGFYLDIAGATTTRFFANGNVVIDGASPVDAGFKLDVAGTGRYTGILYANSRLNVNGASDSVNYQLNVTGRIRSSGQMESGSHVYGASGGIFNGVGIGAKTYTGPGYNYDTNNWIVASNSTTQPWAFYITNVQGINSISSRGAIIRFALTTTAGVEAGVTNIQSNPDFAYVQFSGQYATTAFGSQGETYRVNRIDGQIDDANARTFSWVGHTISPILNSGLSNATIRGYFYNPTLTVTPANNIAFEATSGIVRLGNLAGTGTRMVVANSSGVLSTQAIPSGNAGTVTSIATTGPITGGTITSSGTIGITQATTSTDGYLSSTDWNTFNNKQSALTNPVTGTGTTNTLPKFTGSSTIGNSNITDTGSLITLGSNSFLNGNVGVGVTPSAWGSGQRAIQTPAGAIWNFNASNMTVVQNVFSDGTEKYVNNGFASSYNQNSGRHVWQTAPSGTAGNAISYTQVMAINANGNVLINTNTDAGFRLDVNGTARVQGNATLAGNSNSSSGLFSIFGTGGNNQQLNLGAVTFGVASGNSESIRIQTPTINPSSGSFYYAGLDFNGSIISASGTYSGQIFGIRNAPASIAIASGTYYGIYSTALTAATNVWNLFMDGTASNYLGGDTAIGTTTLGTATKFTLGGSETASSAIARGQLINTTLVASANNDRLIGLDISPTFTNGAFTGVSNIALRVGASIDMQGATIGNIGSGQTLLFAGAGTGEIRLTNGPGGGFFYTYYTNGSEKMRLSPTNGNLLLNTTTDSGFRLDVNGTARVQGGLTTTADILVNTISIGLGGGSVATNTRVGLNVLAANTTGSNNTGMGVFSLQNNTTSSHNTAYGSTALRNIVSSSENNTAIGSNAARNIADGATAMTISNNSIFLGAFTKALADNQTNQIVIGYNTVGLGSNTTIIGNSSTTLTALYGSLITGGTSVNASAQLQVDSTTKGFLPPRMTLAQRTAISTPAEGLIVYQTDGTVGLYIYSNATWRSLTMV